MNEEDILEQEIRLPGVGATLRAGREAMGWSVIEAGGRLRLMARQIEAMEADDFASLGQPVFARGFVRNYAKLLGLDAEALLAQMALVSVQPAPLTENVPFAPTPGFWTSPWVLGPMVALVLALAVPVGLYFWLNRGEPEEHAAQPIEQPVLPPLPPPAPVTEIVPDMQPEPGMPVAPATTPAVPAQQAVPPVSAQPAAAHAIPAQPATATVEPAVVKPAASLAPLPVPLRPPLPAIPAPQAPAVAPAPLQPAAAAQTIRFRFAQPSWLQVRDASGRLVHSALNQGGSALEVKGTPPFALVVGNAANVAVTYKNQAIDLKPFTDVTVARFTLN